MSLAYGRLVPLVAVDWPLMVTLLLLFLQKAGTVLVC